MTTKTPNEHVERCARAAHVAHFSAAVSDPWPHVARAVIALDRPIYAAELLARLTSKEAWLAWEEIVPVDVGGYSDDILREYGKAIRAAFAVATSKKTITAHPNDGESERYELAALLKDSEAGCARLKAEIDDKRKEADDLNEPESFTVPREAMPASEPCPVRQDVIAQWRSGEAKLIPVTVGRVLAWLVDAENKRQVK